MIAPIKKQKLVSDSSLLPPCWLRRGPTSDDTGQRQGRLQRIGPDHAAHSCLVDAVDNAEEVVIASTFLLADLALTESLLNAVARGVRVYLLTASDTQVAKVVREDEQFDARMVEEHKRLLDRLAGRVLLRSAEHFHAKFLVADPGSAPSGWLSTANFNLALKKSVELLVELTPAEADCAADWFSWAFWNEADKELLEKGRLAAVKLPPTRPKAPRSNALLVTTTEHQMLRAEVLRLIREAKTELLVSSYGMAADHDLVLAMAEKARSGVPVVVYTRPRPAVVPAVKLLRDAGATILAHDKLHAKAIWSDAGALVMSANLERHGMDQSFEMGVALGSKDAADLKRLLLEWKESFPWSFELSAPIQSHLGEICLSDQGLRSGRRDVIEEHTVAAAPVVAEDALLLDRAPEPQLPAAPADLFAHRVRYEWEVQPPKLPRNAKEKLRQVEVPHSGKGSSKKPTKREVSFEPRLYRHGGQTYVMLEELGSADAARILADKQGGKVVIR